MTRVLSALVLMLFCAPASAITGNAPAAPVNGRHAVLIVGSHGTFCTGAAIARDLVLTAGHCVEADTHYKIVEFDVSHQPQLLDVRETARHPQFDMKTLNGHRATADVALLKLAHPLPHDIVRHARGWRAHAASWRDADRLRLRRRHSRRRQGGGTLRAARLGVTGQPGTLGSA